MKGGVQMVNTSDKFNSLEQLDTRMDYCLDSWYDYSTKRRIEIVEIYLEWFWKFTERIPQPTRLKELSDFILMEELADTHPDKVTRKEYPILTGKQVERRNKKTVLTGEESTTDYLNVKYNTWSIGNGTHVHRKITTDKRA